MSYTVARIEDIPETTDGREPWRPVRHHLGIKAFGVNVWTGKAAGDRIINEHDEADGPDEELYLVLSGRARFELGDEQLDAPTGTLVFVQPETRRTAFAEEADTSLLALGGRRGGVYNSGGWELWAPVNPLYRDGEYAQAAEKGREIADANPEYWALAYNVACCEALAGHPAEALAYLRKAIDGSDQALEYAKGDSDLDSLRDDPAFKELVGSG